MHVIGVAQVCSQSGLGGLVLQITSQIGSPQSAAQMLFLVTEEVLGYVVGALDDRHDLSLLVAPGRVAEQVLPVTIKIFHNDDAG